MGKSPKSWKRREFPTGFQGRVASHGCWEEEKASLGHWRSGENSGGGGDLVD